MPATRVCLDIDRKCTYMFFPYNLLPPCKRNENFSDDQSIPLLDVVRVCKVSANLKEQN